MDRWYGEFEIILPLSFSNCFLVQFTDAGVPPTNRKLLSKLCMKAMRHLAAAPYFRCIKFNTSCLFFFKIFIFI
jgi:hypothetical protein